MYKQGGLPVSVAGKDGIVQFGYAAIGVIFRSIARVDPGLASWLLLLQLPLLYPVEPRFARIVLEQLCVSTPVHQSLELPLSF